MRIPQSCLDQLFCGEPINGCFCEKKLRNSSQKLSRILKTLKTDDCSLQACNLLNKNSITELFLDIFQRCNLQLRLRRGFSKFQKVYFLEHTNARDRVFDRIAECGNSSYHLLERDLNHKCSLSSFKNSGNNHRKQLRQNQFSVQLQVVNLMA